MKNLLLLIADMAMNKSGSYRWIAAFILGRIRYVSMVLVFSILGLVFISSALDMIILDLQRTSEAQQQLGITSVSAIGLGIIFLSLTAICLFFRKSAWGMTAKATEAVTEPPQQIKSEPALEVSPLMQALSVLVLDYVDERREKRIRQMEAEQQFQHSQKPYDQVQNSVN